MDLNSELERLEKYNPIDKALREAKKKHLAYPVTFDRQALILLEEAGEIAKAVNQFIEEGGDAEEIRKELYQTAAMCMRMLENFDFTLKLNLK